MNIFALILSVGLLLLGSWDQLPKDARIICLWAAAVAAAAGIYASLGAPNPFPKGSANEIVKPHPVAPNSSDFSRQAQILADDLGPRMDLIVLKAVRAAAASNLSNQAKNRGVFVFPIGEQPGLFAKLRYAGAPPSWFDKLRCFSSCDGSSGINGLGVAIGRIDGYSVDLAGAWIEGHLRAGELSADVVDARGLKRRCVYRGEFNADTNLPEGEGRIRIDGMKASYSGQVMDGSPSGYGVLTLENGRQVEEALTTLPDVWLSYKSLSLNPLAPFAEFCARLAASETG